MNRFTQFCAVLFLIFLSSCGDSFEEIGDCQCEEGYEG